MNHNKSNRYLCAVLAAALMLGSTACGGSETVGEDTTVSGETTAPEKLELVSGVPEGVDYGGDTFTFLNLIYFEKQFKYFDIEESTGDLLDDAIYNRNLTAMENLGLQFEIMDMRSYQFANIRTTIMAGDDAWDTIIGIQFRLAELTPEGLFTDLMDMPYIDTEKPWWATNYIDQFNIGDKHRYLLTGDFSIGHFAQYGCMYYNKALYEDYYKEPNALYKTVLDGKWTVDKMYELASGVSRDLNGDNKIDYEHDAVGMAYVPNSYITHHMVYAAGAGITVEEGGEYVLKGVTDKNASIIEKVNRLVNENPGFTPLPTDVTEASDVLQPVMFGEDRLLFMLGLVTLSDTLRDMDSDFGIIPYPKYEESGSYRSLVHDRASTLAVPITCQDTDRAAAVMEEITFLGYRDMMPTYYEIVLKQKYMRDDQNEAMQIIDMIHDNGTTELAFLYNQHIGLWGPLFTESIALEKPLASQFASRIGAANESLAKLIEFFNK